MSERKDQHDGEQTVDPVSRNVMRCLDGEMSVSELAEFERQQAADPALAEQVAEARRLAEVFAVDRHTSGVEVPVGFAAGVLEAARRAPLVDSPRTLELEVTGVQQQEIVAATHLARVLMVAAAALAGVALLVFAGLLRQTESRYLEASPAEIQQVIDELSEQASRELSRPGQVPVSGGERR